jgi:hypothetical protein
VPGDKLEVSENFATRRQRTPLRRHALDVPAQLNLFDEERIASLAVGGAFIRKMDLVGFRELLGGRERCCISHHLSFSSVS